MNAGTLNKTASALAISALALAAGNALASQVGPTLPVGGNTSMYVIDDDGYVHSTDNGGFVDTGAARATAVYTGNDGSASVTIKGGSTSSESAGASVTWSFEVLGPEGVSPVPLFLLGEGKLLNNNASSASAIEDRASVSSSVPTWNTSVSIGKNTQETFGIRWNGQVFDNQVYYVTLSVDAFSYGGTSAFIQASIDPAINFADGFDSTGYTLVSSPVPGAVTAVPEPAIGWMMLAGATGLFAMGRRRSARASAR